MELSLQQIKDMHDHNFQANQVTRRKAADDRIFSRVSQWDDGLLEDSQLAYRGEFNLIRKATRQIQADLRANPIQVDFAPKDEDREDGAEVLDGIYLTSDRTNSSLESYDNAALECIDCGIGGWLLYTEYETNDAGDKNQVIKRRPIYEANNNSFPDANAKRLDKSDAMNWSILEAFTKDGYKRLYKELTGKETDASPADFASPEESYVFPWVSGRNELFYIVQFYHKELIKDKVLTFSDPMGAEVKYRESDVNKTIDGEEISVMDELMDQGYEQIDEKKIKRYKVWRYYASGEEILKVEEVAGPNIPVIHTYGERTFIEGEEVWEGVVRLAKDPQRLRNFMLSYLADIVSRSPRGKPIFNPEQVAGFEFMYENAGADNAYPYYLLQSKDAQGNPLPQQPIGYMPGAEIPKGLSELAIETREAVKDVADPGLPNDIADPDLSGYAIEQLQARFDQQSMVYQHNLKFAKRWDAEIYAGMASVVYDAPRRVTLTGRDGERRRVTVMETILDKESGELVTLNDLTNQEFEVYAEIGPSYASKREKTQDELKGLASEFMELDPKLARALLLKNLTLLDGVDLEDIRDYGNKQLLLDGIKEPKTEEEIQFVEESKQQQEQPDPAMVLAQAEQLKGQAAQMREQRMEKSDQAKAQTEQGKLEVDVFKAETSRMEVMVEAQEAGANIELTKAKTVNIGADTIAKITAPYRARASAAQ